MTAIDTGRADDIACVDLVRVQTFGPFARLIFATVEHEVGTFSPIWVVCAKLLVPVTALQPIGQRLLLPPTVIEPRVGGDRDDSAVVHH